MKCSFSCFRGGQILAVVRIPSSPTCRKYSCRSSLPPSPPSDKRRLLLNRPHLSGGDRGPSADARWLQMSRPGSGSLFQVAGSSAITAECFCRGQQCIWRRTKEHGRHQWILSVAGIKAELFSQAQRGSLHFYWSFLQWRQWGARPHLKRSPVCYAIWHLKHLNAPRLSTIKSFSTVACGKFAVMPCVSTAMQRSAEMLRSDSGQILRATQKNLPSSAGKLTPSPLSQRPAAI